MANNVLLKGEKLQDEFLGNDWWSLTGNFNLEGYTVLSKWTIKSGSEMINGKLIGLNLSPGFTHYNDPNPTNSKGVTLLNKYKVTTGSPLQHSGINLKAVLGLDTGGIDFNGKPAPLKGIGACFEIE